MQTEVKRRNVDSSESAGSPAFDEKRELALLAEFMRARSVASLAGEIAERLGADVRGEDLIAAAGLRRNRRGGADKGDDPGRAQSRS
jgi:hypothetical protein